MTQILETYVLPVVGIVRVIRGSKDNVHGEYWAHCQEIGAMARFSKSLAEVKDLTFMQVRGYVVAERDRLNQRLEQLDALQLDDGFQRYLRVDSPTEVQTTTKEGQ